MGTEQNDHPTEDASRTVRVARNSPGCPGDSWGQMAALPETYNETVDTAQDAARVAAESGEDDPGPGYRLVEPRPDVIKWKHREISVPDTYDADT